MADISTLQLADGAKIAYRRRPGKSPGVMFCPGYHSTMEGDKAVALDRLCAEIGQAYTRFDYQGHGMSSGAFAEGTIGTWRDDALAVLDRVAEGPQVLIGSSMGAWIALLLAGARPRRIHGLVLIAPAPDFPTRLLWPSLDDTARAALEDDGVWYRPSEFEPDPYPVTMRLIEESKRHAVLDRAPVAYDGPVRILHGTRDEVVPVEHALACLNAVSSTDLTLTLIKDGDHRLSSPRDLERLAATVLDAVPGARSDQPRSNRSSPVR